MRHSLTLFAALFLFGCAAPDTAPQNNLEPSETGPALWQFDDAAAALRLASCPMGVSYQSAEDLPITVTEIERGLVAPATLHGLRFAGAWQLTATDERFGGLSGLAVHRSGSLLAISDAGSWINIGIDPDTGAPDGLGSVSQMRALDGSVAARKIDRDSEGLALRDGLALVSFEQDHRIEAFDLESCGSAARGVLVTKLPERVEGQKIPDNRGAEGLGLAEDGTLSLGFEVRGQIGSPLGVLEADGSLTQQRQTAVPFFYRLTGLDISGALTAELYRAYDPFRGSRILVFVLEEGAVIAKADLKGDMPIDNFEGVAFGTNLDGETRLWLISDDNFSATQRTLLFALDLPSSAEERVD